MSEAFQIYVTGVVGRSMGSGQFGAEHIDGLTKAAVDAFKAHLAPEMFPPQQSPRPAPGASQAPQRASGSGGFKNNDVEPETKPFSMWGGDKSYVFGRNDAIWGDLLGEAQEGSQEAVELLKKTANGKIGDDPKWQSNNAKRIARAKACLLMLESGKTT